MDPTPSHRAQALLVVVVVILVVAVAGYFAYRDLRPTAASSSLPSTRTYIDLTITYDNATGIANYSTPFISMVANTLVLVNITNFDPTASPLFVPWDNRVVGTVGDNATVNCGQGPRTIGGLPSDGVSHTFTVLDAYYNFSVPIAPAVSESVPCVTSFELVLAHAEMTTWGCVANCDNGQMAAGRMWGLLLIEG